MSRVSKCNRVKYTLVVLLLTIIFLITLFKQALGADTNLKRKKLLKLLKYLLCYTIKNALKKKFFTWAVQQKADYILEIQLL